MTNDELKEVFKDKLFKLSSDKSDVYFGTDEVFKNSERLGKYYVKVNNGDFIMTFEARYLEPFQNIWVIPIKGRKILLNRLTEKLMSGDTISLTEIQE